MFEPENISGTIIEWVPTVHLRWFGRRRRDADLEQLWINQSTGEEEWREIEFVHQGRVR